LNKATAKESKDSSYLEGSDPQDPNGPPSRGGNFWMKHFEPVVYTVRRCVDERITKEMMKDE